MDWGMGVMSRVNGRWTNASASDNKVITSAHAADSLHDILLIIRNDLDALELNTKRKAKLGEEGRVCVDGLDRRWLALISLVLYSKDPITFPPSTSSPMMRHAAVWMGFACAGDVIADRAVLDGDRDGRAI